MNNIIQQRGVALAKKLKEDPRAFLEWKDIAWWMEKEAGFPPISRESLQVHNSRRWRIALEATARKKTLCLLPPLDSPSSPQEIERLCQKAIKEGARTWEMVASNIRKRKRKLGRLNECYLPYNLLFWSLAFNWDVPKMSKECTGLVPFAAKRDEIGEALITAIRDDPGRFTFWDEVADWVYEEYAVRIDASRLKKESSKSWRICLQLSSYHQKPVTHPKSRYAQGASSEYLATRDEIHRILLNILEANPRQFRTWREVAGFFNQKYPHLTNRYGEPLTLDWFYQQNHRYLRVNLPKTYETEMLVRT